MYGSYHYHYKNIKLRFRDGSYTIFFLGLYTSHYYRTINTQMCNKVHSRVGLCILTYVPTLPSGKCLISGLLKSSLIATNLG